MRKLNMDDWRRIFQGQIREAKPNHVWSLKMDQQLDYKRLQSGWAQALQEHAHASFRCSQCYHSWASHQVVILFLMCQDQSYHQGWVWMKVFRQQCDKCTPEKYEEPQFTKTDVDNIIRRLILDIREKCYRERDDRSELSEVVWEHTGPHKPRYCEACKLGIHKWRRQSPKAAQHHGKAKSAKHSRNTEEKKTSPQPPTDSTSPAMSCVGCFCLIVIFILIFIAFLSYWVS
ncbi:receptor-transporting protein 1-like [Heteronotia binoei]|uniref:receptor-transporting protein 1-like n=1 Tax=Heteronotia binoei TaxID=13085 RepID=UPI00292E4B86|nr:receptor-transporting protein 1-like [Heteronotia binoei]